MACLICFATSTVTSTVVFLFYSDAPRLSRLVARFMLASIFVAVITSCIVI